MPRRRGCRARYLRSTCRRIDGLCFERSASTAFRPLGRALPFRRLDGALSLVLAEKCAHRRGAWWACFSLGLRGVSRSRGGRGGGGGAPGAGAEGHARRCALPARRKSTVITEQRVTKRERCSSFGTPCVRFALFRWTRMSREPPGVCAQCAQRGGTSKAQEITRACPACCAAPRRTWRWKKRGRMKSPATPARRLLARRRAARRGPTQENSLARHTYTAVFSSQRSPDPKT